MNMSVCLSVCLSARIYWKPHGRSSLIFVHVDCGRGSVLFWLRCGTFCTSGFVDDVYGVHIVDPLSRPRPMSYKRLEESVTAETNTSIPTNDNDPSVLLIVAKSAIYDCLVKRDVGSRYRRRDVTELERDRRRPSGKAARTSGTVNSTSDSSSALRILVYQLTGVNRRGLYQRICLNFGAQLTGQGRGLCLSNTPKVVPFKSIDKLMTTLPLLYWSE